MTIYHCNCMISQAARSNMIFLIKRSRRISEILVKFFNHEKYVQIFTIEQTLDGKILP